MTPFTLAALLALAFLAALTAFGRLRFVVAEVATDGRRAVGLLLLWGVLVACVFYPTVTSGEAAYVDPETLAFPLLFFGHGLIVAFLVAWWLLAVRPPLARFLRLGRPTIDEITLGLRTAGVGWVLALATSALTAVALSLVGLASGGASPIETPFEVPPLLLWLADLPVWRKLIVVGVAMTVEEAFFRAFLQPRIGWIPSSVLFALSHAGYGLPTLMASVFTISLVLGWALRRSGRLLPCVIAHGVFDAVQLLLIIPIAVRYLHEIP